MNTFDSDTFDGSKMDFLIRTSGLMPEKTWNTTWMECMLKTSSSAQKLAEEIKAIGSKEWVRAMSHL